MIKDDIFEKARNSISQETIKRFFPDAEDRGGGELYIKSPFRDEKTASMSINSNGLWYDHGSGEGGDFISLISNVEKIPLIKAAELIAESISFDSTTAHNTQPRRKAIIPVPLDKIDSILDATDKHWTREKYGKRVHIARYARSKDELCFFVVRYEQRNGGKCAIPFYFSDHGWVSGLPPEIKSIPLYRIDKINTNNILVVEGEKCASQNVDGYSLVSWLGGASKKAIERAEWDALKNRDYNIFLWPDNDEKGIEAMKTIQSKIGGIMIQPKKEWPQKYDIADYIDDGENPAALIERAKKNAGEIGKKRPPPRGQGKIQRAGKPSATQENAGNPPRSDMITIQNKQFRTESQEFSEKKVKKSEKNPFTELGIEKGGGHIVVFDNSLNDVLFLPASEQALGGRLYSLAPHQWWVDRFPADREGFKIRKSEAVNWLISICRKKGLYSNNNVKGIGAHLDNDQIIINTGKKLYTTDGKEISHYDDSLTHMYESSRRTIPLPTKAWSGDEGQQLIDQLSNSYNFEAPEFALALAGWMAVAPWSNLCRKSSHIWITGSSGAGKSHLLEHVITPALGPACRKNEGAVTEAGIRQDLGRDCLPVVLDEFEPETQRAQKTIDAILALARASYGGGEIVKGSTLQKSPHYFRTQSAFCFASVQTRLQSAANSSRIIKIEMGLHKTSFKFSHDFEGLRGLMVSHLPNLKRVNDFFYSDMISCGVSPRTADTWSSLAAGAFFLLGGTDVDSSNPFIIDICRKIYAIANNDNDLSNTSDNETDEERALSTLLSGVFRPGHGSQEISVAQAAAILIKDAAESSQIISDMYGDDTDLTDALQRFGCRIDTKNERTTLSVAPREPALTSYMARNGLPGFAAILQRHPAAEAKRHLCKINKRAVKAIVLDITNIIE